MAHSRVPIIGDPPPDSPVDVLSSVSDEAMDDEASNHAGEEHPDWHSELHHADEEQPDAQPETDYRDEELPDAQPETDYADEEQPAVTLLDTGQGEQDGEEQRDFEVDEDPYVEQDLATLQAISNGAWVAASSTVDETISDLIELFSRR